MKFPPKRILVVEDDAVFQERLASSLRRRGHEVMTASRLDEVMVLLSGFSPECAVIDLRLEGESGLVVARSLRENLPQIRILILTGYGSIATAVDAMRLGAVDYLSKPADTSQIEAALFSESAPIVAAEQEAPVPSLERVEWEHMQRVLRDNGGNISATARKLGIERRTLQRKLWKYPPES
ncbi:MAG: response regulator [Luteolibacter sp.]|jgi:two-component system response regulator RegA|nr:response regulator [Luteolibacter sp.]